MEHEEETLAERAWRDFHANLEAENAAPQEDMADPQLQVSPLFNTAVSLQNSVVTRALPDLKALARSHHLEEVAFQARLHACAEAALRGQADLLRRLSRYSTQLHLANDLVPVCFIEHALIDATPLTLTVEQDGERTTERANVFVAEGGWTLLLREQDHDQERPQAVVRQVPAKYLLLTGRHSTALRTAQSSSGEGTAAVLQSVDVPGIRDLAATFGLHFRVMECDGAPSNMRSEKIFLGESRNQDDCLSFILVCLLHKVHSAAEKSWTMSPLPQLLSGILHCGLFFSGPHIFHRFRAALRSCLSNTPLIIYKQHPCPREAIAYRTRLVKMFSPSREKQPRRHATLQVVSAKLLNGDWRVRGGLQHYCDGSCCNGEEDCRDKIISYGMKLLAAVRPHIFKKNNWSEWIRGLRSFGILEGVHGLFTAAFERAFGRPPPQEPEAIDVAGPCAISLKSPCFVRV